MIQNLVFYDKRLIQLDPEPEEVILSDQKRLKVDSFTRFRIVNPLLFYQTVLTERKAIERRITSYNVCYTKLLRFLYRMI